MTKYVPIEMYLALADEKKAYMEKSEFLKSENKKLRAERQRFKIEIENTEEEMELIYSQYKIHVDQNLFLKGELEKMRTSPILSMTPTILPNSLPPLSEIPEPPVYEDLLLEDNLGNYFNETELPGASMIEPVLRPVVSNESRNETIWCGPEHDAKNLLENRPIQGEPEDYMIENVPSTMLPSSIPQIQPPSAILKKKSSKTKRPMLGKTSSVPVKKIKLEVDETPTNFVCRITPCKSTIFQSLDAHHEHLATDHQDKLFICSRCPYASSNKYTTRIHEGNHEKNELVYRESHVGVHCTLCDITFATGTKTSYKGALRKHQRQFH